MQERPAGRRGRSRRRWRGAVPSVTRRFDTAVGASLAGLILLVYSGSFQAGLVLDSAMIVGADPRIQTWSAENLRLIFTENYWWPFAPSDLYRPVTTLTFLLQRLLPGVAGGVAGYHAVNLLLHALNAWLVFSLLARLGARRHVAWLAAAIFAVHPIHVEAVTNIVGRADLLATAAVLGGLVCYVRAGGAKQGARAGWLGAAGFCAWVGVWAKETAVMIFPLALLYDLIWRGPAFRAQGARDAGAWGREFGLKGALVFLPALLGLWGVRGRLAEALTPPGLAFVDNPIAYASWWDGVLTALGVAVRYVGRLLLPHPLSCDYSFDAVPLAGAGRTFGQDAAGWLGLILLGGLLWLVGRGWRRWPLVVWGVAFFLVALLPTANLLLPIGSIMAERFLYLPSIGFVTVASIGLCWVLGRSRGALGVVSAALLVALGWRTHARNADWRDELTLWRSAVATTPHSFKAHVGYAAAVWETAQTEAALDLALAETEQARAILARVPAHVERREVGTWLQLGTFQRIKGEVLAKQNRSAEARARFAAAIAALKEASEIDRRNRANYRAAVQRRVGEGRPRPEFSGNVKIPLELAACHLALGDWAALAADAREIQRIVPGAKNGYVFAGVAEANGQQFEAAIVSFLAAVLADPADQEPRRQLAACFERLGMRPSPVTVTATAVNLDSADPRLRPYLEAAFARLIANHEAAQRLREAVELREVAAREFKISVERRRESEIVPPAKAGTNAK